MTADKALPSESGSPETPRASHSFHTAFSPSQQASASPPTRSTRSSIDHTHLPKPLGPRSPHKRDTEKSQGSVPDSRHHAGSSRTKFSTLPAQSTQSPSKPFPSVLGISEDKQVTSEPSAIEDNPYGRYRSPEPVHEPEEENPPGYFPAVIEDGADNFDWTGGSPTTPVLRMRDSSPLDGDKDFDLSRWQAGLSQDTAAPYDSDANLDQGQPEKPQTGPGVLPRRLLQLIHEHELVRPTITGLPHPSKKTQDVQQPSTDAPPSAPPPASPAPSFSTIASAQSATSSNASRPVSTISNIETASTEQYIRSHTIQDVEASLPGGADHAPYYFCPLCWAWLRVEIGRGDLPESCSFEAHDWDSGVALDRQLLDSAKGPNAIADPVRGRGVCKDILESRMVTGEEHHHFHEFRDTVTQSDQTEITRVPVEDDLSQWPHQTWGMEMPSEWTLKTSPKSPARLYMSSSSDAWVYVEQGMVGGQLSPGLASAFSGEKMSNPNPGIDGPASVNDAWALVLTLLQNPLFKGQRGWVKLNNKTFSRRIGSSLVSSMLLYSIGFACRQDPDELRIGPYPSGVDESDKDLIQMDAFMIRTWVEVSLFLRAWQKRNGVEPKEEMYISPISLEEVFDMQGLLQKYSKSDKPAPDTVAGPFRDLGLSKFDSCIETAYRLQVDCDMKNAPRYLDALEQISKVPMPNREALYYLIASERSLGKYTTSDLLKAYERIGYTAEHASEIGVEPDEAPDEYILDLHKTAMQATTNPSDRSDISAALALIGQHRDSGTLRRLGGSGQTFLSVDEAYAALSAPRNSIDDGLLMQYEMAVNEYPGKVEHYRMCLSIIANAPGEERPGIKTFLETGNKESDIPARKDIPVGLQNIGNTCYLNSILQYLYSVKPIREAVLAFEQDPSFVPIEQKAEVERSRRFVRQLRLLFLQLYKAEQPAVRPDEELAYLAITRPEVDQIVEPAEPRSILDDIPNVPSPSSTRVNTPEPSPPASPRTSTTSGHDRSILGKRASQDRESSGSGDERPRKSEGFEQSSKTSAVEEEMMTNDEEFELVPKPHEESADSPAAQMDLASLDLKSPDTEKPIPLPLPKNESTLVPPPKPPALPPRRESKATLASGLRFGLQQDSAEVLINVLSQLETAFEAPANDDGSPGKNLIADLFSCKYRQQIIYQSKDGDDTGTPVESVFVHPIIGVEEEGKDLYDCLAELYLGGADIEYEGKKGHMMDLMDEFPPMLYIQMRRSQYDIATGRERKTNTHIAFDQVLAMDRYLANADSSKRAQSIDLTRDMIRIRTRLHQLRNHKPLSMPATFEHLRGAFEHLSSEHETELDITKDFLDALTAEVEEIKAEIRRLEESLPALKKRMDGIWEGEREFEYELVSVFMHRGKTSGAGHYWTYQAYLPDHSDRFFKYNDEVVTEVPASEVLQDRTGDDANPALLCYVRRNKGLIDTLHREILEREAADAAQALQAEAESNEVSVPNQRNVGPEEGHGLLIDLEGTSGSGLKNAGADGDVTMTSQTQSLTDSQMLSQLERDQAEDLLS